MLDKTKKLDLDQEEICTSCIPCMPPISKQKYTPLQDLIKEAQYMLLDKEEIEQDLIYSICKLTDEERTAIVLAYKILRETN